MKMKDILKDYPPTIMKALAFLEWFLNLIEKDTQFIGMKTGRELKDVAQFYNRPLDIRDFVCLPEEEPNNIIGYAKGETSPEWELWKNRPIFEGWEMVKDESTNHGHFVVNGQRSSLYWNDKKKQFIGDIGLWSVNDFIIKHGANWNPSNPELKKLGLV